MDRLILFLLMFSLTGQETSRIHNDTREVLKRIANGIIRETSYEVIDTLTHRVLNGDEMRRVIPTSLFRSDYNDWTYFNGVILSGMMRAGETLGEEKYSKYVSDNFDFIFNHLEYFHDQWEVLQVKRASLYRIYRMNMLDDCGAMGAALIEAYQLTNDQRYWRMIEKIANYITNVQLRNDEGALTRPDPRYMTLWADDLYMSVPFLVRMGKLTGDCRYYDDAARQVILFFKHLLHSEKKILHHAWFNDTDERSVGLWGRANGWVMMAHVELLHLMPQDHPKRDTLLAILRAHIDGLVPLQSQSGLWHQLLDRDDSFLETSCSAMFTYGIARAVNNGWIDRSYARLAQEGWKGVISKIRPDGKIEGICQGTEVGFTLQFYYDRSTPLNDPRGVGAVLLAGCEMLVLEGDRLKR